MLELSRMIFGEKTATDFTELVRQGAVIVDVRTPGEYQDGHIEGSVNISVGRLKESEKLLPAKSSPIITCCATGGRSASAKDLLESLGYTRVYNGGGWAELKDKLR